MQHSHEKLKADLKKWQMPALIAGVVGLAATAGAYATMGSEKGFFWEVYLMSFMLVAALTLGSLGFLLLSHLATGRWFHFIQPALAAGAKNILYLMILFAGVWAGRGHLYQEWINRGHGGNVPQADIPFNPADFLVVKSAQAEHAAGAAKAGHAGKAGHAEQAGHAAEQAGHAAAAGHAAEAHHPHPIEAFNRAKHAYMTDTMWQTRVGICFALWIVLIYLLTTWQKKQADTAGGEPWGVLQRRLSGVGIILFGLSSTVLAFDLLVALNAKWFSSIYGAITFVSFGLTTLAFLGMFMCKVRDYEPYRIYMTSRYSHDIGTMMFAFTVLWTYMQAGQLIIIWNGNMIEETLFYLKRMEHGWVQVDWFLFLCVFIAPFLLLLNQPLKRNKNSLAVIGAWVFLMRYAVWYWEIVPWFRGVTFHWVLITAPVGMVGLWFFLFLRNFIAHPLPVKTDERLRKFLYDVLPHEGAH